MHIKWNPFKTFMIMYVMINLCMHFKNKFATKSIYSFIHFLCIFWSIFVFLKSESMPTSETFSSKLLSFQRLVLFIIWILILHSTYIQDKILLLSRLFTKTLSPHLLELLSFKLYMPYILTPVLNFEILLCQVINDHSLLSFKTK